MKKIVLALFISSFVTGCAYEPVKDSKTVAEVVWPQESPVIRDDSVAFVGVSHASLGERESYDSAVDHVRTQYLSYFGLKLKIITENHAFNAGGSDSITNHYSESVREELIGYLEKGRVVRKRFDSVTGVTKLVVEFDKATHRKLQVLANEVNAKLKDLESWVTVKVTGYGEYPIQENGGGFARMKSASLAKMRALSELSKKVSGVFVDSVGLREDGRRHDFVGLTSSGMINGYEETIKYDVINEGKVMSASVHLTKKIKKFKLLGYAKSIDAI